MREVSIFDGEYPHPSEFIAEEMRARYWDRATLAVMMGGKHHQNALMLDIYFEVGPDRKDCRIGDVMATQLGIAFDVSPQFFLNLEQAWLNNQPKEPNHDR